MKEGDLITTYYKGFFRLKRVEKRFVTQADIDRYSNYKDKKVGEEYSPLYYFTQEYDVNGNIKKSKEKVCDASFCKLAKEYIDNELSSMLAKILIPPTEEEKQYKAKIRQKKNENIDKQIQERLKTDNCSKCQSNLKQTRKGSKVVQCINEQCKARFQYKSKKK